MRRQKWGGSIAVGIVAIGVMVVALLVQIGATQMVHHRGPLATADRLKATNDARISLIQLLGAVGLLGGLLYTARTYALTRLTQQTSRFTTAVGQVGDKDSETARAGGVYGLWMLTQEDGSYWPSVEQVLASLVRERATSSHTGDLIDVDVQAAITVLGRRPTASAAGLRGGISLDLSNAKLRGANLVRANLEWMRLDGADLEGANLSDARCGHATFVDARMTGATLSSADLSCADLTGATATTATFYKTNMYKATLTGCDLTAARNLTEALNLTPAQLAQSTGAPAAIGP